MRMPPKAQSHPESLRFKNRFVTGEQKDRGVWAGRRRPAPLFPFLPAKC